jgi:site-specific recombinase XerD
LGHEKIATTSIYLHPSEQALADEVERAESRTVVNRRGRV